MFIKNFCEDTNNNLIWELFRWKFFFDADDILFCNITLLDFAKF